MISNLLDAERAARLVQQHALDPSLPGLDDVVNAISEATFRATAATPYEAEIARATQRVLVDNLMGLAASAAMPQVRAIAMQKLQQRMTALSALSATAGDRGANAALLVSDIKRFMDRPLTPVQRMDAPAIPPGAPIGDPALEYIRRFEPECAGWVDR